jgi:hypothetical protein
MDRKRLAAPVVSGVLLASCSQVDLGATPVDGEWVGTQGGVVATFQGGNFTSRLADSQQVIARGTYRMTSGTEIRMDWQTPAKQRFSATCTLAGVSVLYCKQKGGGDLVLQRAA